MTISCFSFIVLIASAQSVPKDIKFPDPPVGRSNPSEDTDPQPVPSIFGNRQVSPERVFQEDPTQDLVTEGFSESIVPLDDIVPLDKPAPGTERSNDKEPESPAPPKLKGCSAASGSCIFDEGPLQPEEVDEADLDTRIVGGRNSPKGKWNWIVAILAEGNDEPFCGGTLITRRHVLTAAHCIVVRKKVLDERLLLIRAGEYDFTRIEGTEEDFGVSSIDIHPGYNVKNFNNDIAILTLDRRASPGFSLGIFVPNVRRAHIEGQELTVIGWGRTKHGGNNSDILQEVTLPVWTDEECLKVWDTKYYKPGKTFCAGVKEGGKDSCQGDSGGPFVSEFENGYIIDGVVSVGIKCAQPNQPGIYTRVQAYLPWINDIVQKRISPGCKSTAAGTEYDGSIRYTGSRFLCQRWDADSPQEVIVGKDEEENYCRNPNNDPQGPWCYTQDKKVRFDYCNIPSCTTNRFTDRISGNSNILPQSRPSDRQPPLPQPPPPTKRPSQRPPSRPLPADHVIFPGERQRPPQATHSIQDPIRHCEGVTIGGGFLNVTCTTESTVVIGHRRFRYTRSHWVIRSPPPRRHG